MYYLQQTVNYLSNNVNSSSFIGDWQGYKSSISSSCYRFFSIFIFIDMFPQDVGDYGSSVTTFSLIFFWFTITLRGKKRFVSLISSCVMYRCIPWFLPVLHLLSFSFSKYFLLKFTFVYFLFICKSIFWHILF